MLELFGPRLGVFLCYMASKYKYFEDCGKLFDGESFYLHQKTIAAETKCSLDTVQRDSKKAEAEGILLMNRLKGEVNYYGINEQAWPEECRHLLHGNRPQNAVTLRSNCGHHSGQFAAHSNKNVVQRKNKKQGVCVFDVVKKQERPWPDCETIALKILTTRLAGYFEDECTMTLRHKHQDKEMKALPARIRNVVAGYEAHNCEQGFEDYVHYLFNCVRGLAAKYGQEYVAVKWFGKPSAFKAMDEYLELGQWDDDEAEEVRRTIWTRALREQHKNSLRERPRERRKEIVSGDVGSYGA